MGQAFSKGTWELLKFQELDQVGQKKPKTARSPHLPSIDATEASFEPTFPTARMTSFPSLVFLSLSNSSFKKLLELKHGGRYL